MLRIARTWVTQGGTKPPVPNCDCAASEPWPLQHCTYQGAQGIPGRQGGCALQMPLKWLLEHNPIAKGCR